MLQEIEKSVILKQEYGNGTGKYYILVKTDKSAIAFYGSYGGRESMNSKVFPREKYESQKSTKEREYDEDRNRTYDTYIPKKHKQTFIDTIKSNSDFSNLKEAKEKEKIEKEKEAFLAQQKEADRLKQLKLEKDKEIKKINTSIDNYGGISL